MTVETVTQYKAIDGSLYDTKNEAARANLKKKLSNIAFGELTLEGKPDIATGVQMACDVLAEKAGLLSIAVSNFNNEYSPEAEEHTG